MLDTWGWHCASLPEAVAIHRKLAGYRGAHWPDWEATLRRLHAAAPFAVHEWFARLPQRQRTWEHKLTPAQTAPAVAAPAVCQSTRRAPEAAAHQSWM